MKVLHLPFGGQMTVLCRALREVGVDATACHFRSSKFGFQPDVLLPLESLPLKEQEARRRDFLKQAAEEYDVFHFHFGETFLPDCSDLAYLKERGKKLVMQHRGSDVRLLSVARSQGNPYVRVKKRDPDQIVARLKQLSAWIDHAIVSDHELLAYVRDYYRHVHIIRQAIDLKRYTPAYPTEPKEEPLIIHAPSNQRVKGTSCVLSAISKLELMGFRFRFRLIANMPHMQAMECYRQADIVIDQLLIGAFGVFSLEAMAMGKPVICYIRDDLVSQYPPKLPIINANPDTLYQKLKKLLLHPERWHDLGVKGRRYVKQNHDALMIARQLADLYARL